MDSLLVEEIIEYYYNSKFSEISTIEYLTQRLQRYGDCWIILINDNCVDISTTMNHIL